MPRRKTPRSLRDGAWLSTTPSLGRVPVESLFPRLEPLLPRVQKPVQYVGGELGVTVKDWDDCDVRWALLYPDAYEVGQPNQGVQILYEILNERAGHARRAHVRRVARPRSADARARRARSSPSTRTGRCGRSTCSASRSPPSSATPTCSRRSTSPGSRCTRRTAPTPTRSSSPAGTRRSTPSRSRTSSTRPSSATVKRRSSLSPTSSGSTRRPAARPSSTLSQEAVRRTSLVVTTSTTCPTGASSGSRPTGPACRSASRSTP